VSTQIGQCPDLAIVTSADQERLFEEKGREKVPRRCHLIDSTDAMPFLLKEGLDLKLIEVWASVEFPRKALSLGLGKSSNAL
jgi:hypothetical protein